MESPIQIIMGKKDSEMQKYKNILEKVNQKDSSSKYPECEIEIDSYKINPVRHTAIQLVSCLQHHYQM